MQKLALDERDLLSNILTEARMKSDLIKLARCRNDLGYCELPFVGAAYDVYFSLLKSYGRDFEGVLGGWDAWLKGM